MQKQHTKRKSNQQGFSLVELAITLSIIGIMAAVAAPMFSAGPTKRLKATARNLWADVRYARMEAVKRRTDIGIQFFPNNGGAAAPFTNNTYIIFLDDGFNGAGNPISIPNAGNGILDVQEGIGAPGTPNAPLKTIRILRDVSLTPFGSLTTLGYNSRALPNGTMNGNIVFQSDPSPNRQYRLTLSQAGSTYIESSGDGGLNWSEN